MVYINKVSNVRKPIFIVIGAVAISYIFINLILEDPVFESKEELIKFAYESKQFALAEETYRSLIDDDSLNLDNYYGHLVSHFNIPEQSNNDEYDTEYRNDSLVYGFYKFKSGSADPFQRDIGRYGLGLFYAIQDMYDDALDYFGQVENRELKYLNNSIGRIYLERRNYEIAEMYFLAEIRLDGNLGGAYPNLIELYLETGQLNKVSELLEEHKEMYFSTADLSEYYTKTGKAFKYLELVLQTGLNNIDLKSFIAALLIMLVWLFYLRRIDPFKPEKWIYVFLIFGMGILFSYGTFFLSDINKHLLGFDLNGSLFNDFMYCFLGIGLIEEAMKLIPFLVMLKFTKEVDEPVDYIIFPSISALGFAFAENILYFHGYGLEIIHGRALISVVIHMICASVVGYGIYFGIGKLALKRTSRIVIFLLLAALIHGFFDFWLINKQVEDLSFISMIFAIIGLYAWNYLIKNSLDHSMPGYGQVYIPVQIALQDYLVYGLSAILLFEYFMVSLSYGPGVGNQSLVQAAASGAYLIAFITLSLGNFKLQRKS